MTVPPKFQSDWCWKYAECRNTELATFLKVAELAELLKVKPRTIYEMIAQNRIPFRKPPGLTISAFGTACQLAGMKTWIRTTCVTRLGPDSRKQVAVKRRLPI